MVSVLGEGDAQQVDRVLGHPALLAVHAEDGRRARLVLAQVQADRRRDVGRGQPERAAGPHRPVRVLQEGPAPGQRHVLDHVVGEHQVDRAGVDRPRLGGVEEQAGVPVGVGHQPPVPGKDAPELDAQRRRQPGEGLLRAPAGKWRVGRDHQRLDEGLDVVLHPSIHERRSYFWRGRSPRGHRGAGTGQGYPGRRLRWACRGSPAAGDVVVRRG
jgi:hypothetical protein